MGTGMESLETTLDGKKKRSQPKSCTMGNCHGGRLMTKNGLVRLERPECAVDFFGLFTSVFVNTAEKSEVRTGDAVPTRHLIG